MDYQFASPPSSKRSRWRLAPGVLALLVLSFGLLSCRGVDWFLLKRSLHGKCRDVDWITTQQLTDWLGDKDRPQPVLLDCARA